MSTFFAKAALPLKSPKYVRSFITAISFQLLKNDFYSFEVCLSSWSFNFSIFPQSGLEAGPNYNLAGLKSMQFFELNNHTGKKQELGGTRLAGIH